MYDGSVPGIFLYRCGARAFKDDYRRGGKSGKPLSEVEPETSPDSAMSEFDREMMEIVEPRRMEDQKKGKPRVSPTGKNGSRRYYLWCLESKNFTGGSSKGEDEERREV